MSCGVSLDIRWFYILSTSNNRGRVENVAQGQRATFLFFSFNINN